MIVKPSHKHAQDRAEVVVTNLTGRQQLGRLLYVKGYGRNARCRVVLASGAYVTVPRGHVEVVG